LRCERKTFLRWKEFDAQLMNHSWSKNPLTFLSVMDKKPDEMKVKGQRGESKLPSPVS